MVVDLTLLNQGIKDIIEIDEDILIDNTNEDILGTKNMHITGSISLDSIQNIDVKLTLSGDIIILDSISLEEVNYPITCEIDEKIEKNEGNLENTIDLSDVLWQNIVLEVPLRFTKVENLDEFKGDGWKVISEEELIKTNNPFEELKSMFGEE